MALTFEAFSFWEDFLYARMAATIMSQGWHSHLKHSRYGKILYAWMADEHEPGWHSDSMSYCYRKIFMDDWITSKNVHQDDDMFFRMRSLIIERRS